MSKSSLVLTLSIIFLFSVGMIMVFNTTSAEVLDKSIESDPYTYLINQSLYAMIGIALGFLLYAIGSERLYKLLPLLFYGVFFSLILVFIPNIGQQLNGAKRWINLMGFSMQPSEFAKYIIPFYFIYELEKLKKLELRDFIKLIAKIALPVGLILIEPDNGTTFIILCTMLAVFILARIRFVYWFTPFILCLAVGGVAAYHMPHVPDRIRIYLHPELDLQGKGHQPYQAKIAAGSGGLWGKGLGESLQKYNYLPEARSDYIAAIYAEEFGFLGINILIAVYMLTAFAGFRISARSSNKKDFYMSAIITFLIAFQAFLNLGVVSNLLPSKGTTLPFISQGGSSLIANIMAFFLLLNIANKRRVTA